MSDITYLPASSWRGSGHGMERKSSSLERIAARLVHHEDPGCRAFSVDSCRWTANSVIWLDGELVSLSGDWVGKWKAHDGIQARAFLISDTPQIAVLVYLT